MVLLENCGYWCMVHRMNERTVLVTGANRGIGRAIADGLGKLGGMKVLLGSRDIDKGKTAMQGMVGDIHVVHLNLLDRDELARQVAAILREHGPIDVLVNNAAILCDGNVLETAEGDFEKSMRVNLVAAYDLIRMLAPGMSERGYGRIVNISSGWGSFGEGLGGPVSYSVSKAALNALTINASRGLPGCVKVNSMCPGWVRTDMGGANAERSPEQGADTAIWLATLPDNGPSGGFFRDRKRIPW